MPRSEQEFHEFWCGHLFELVAEFLQVRNKASLEKLWCGLLLDIVTMVFKGSGLKYLKQSNLERKKYTEKESERRVSLELMNVVAVQHGRKDLNPLLELAYGDEARITAYNPNFYRWFLLVCLLAEKPFSSVKCYRLRERMTDAEIIKELGGEENVEADARAIAPLFKLAAKNAEKQPPSAAPYPNTSGPMVLYLQDGAGILRAFSARRWKEGWRVLANPVESMDRRSPNTQIIVPDFAE